MSELYRENYREIFAGDEQWRASQAPAGDIYQLGRDVHLCPEPAVLRRTCHAKPLPQVEDIRGARALAVFGDSITTDHISPAGTIQVRSPAGEYLVSQAVGAEGLQLIRVTTRQS